MFKDIRDDYVWSKERKILTEQETHINGLVSFGYNHQVNAKRPQDTHIHKNSIEITYVIKGEYYLFVNNKEYVATGGDITVTLPNEPHGTGIAPRAVNEIFWMHINADKIDGFMGLASPWNSILSDTLLSVKGYLFHADLTQVSNLHDAMNCLSQASPFSMEIGRNLIVGFLNYFLRNIKMTSKSISSDINHAITFINSNLNQQISLEQLASISNLSISRFKTKFKEETGVTPNMYITRRKISEAQRLLASGMSVTDTAFALDFSSSNYFATVFKKITSMQPTDYRKKYYKH